jgi:hypothetical protein
MFGIVAALGAQNSAEASVAVPLESIPSAELMVDPAAAVLISTVGGEPDLRVVQPAVPATAISALPPVSVMAVPAAPVTAAPTQLTAPPVVRPAPAPTAAPAPAARTNGSQ